MRTRLEPPGMVFNSITFILFLSVVLSLYYLPLSWRTHKSILLAASYVFYGAWNPPFLLLLWFSTLVDWYAARKFETVRRESTRKALLLVSLISNLGLLGYFKYGGFILENFVALVNASGIPYHPPAPNIILPVGISFYTFQTLSYTIDVYRRRLRATPSILDFALFVTFFPQLVAGPIMRAADFLPQLETRKRATSDEMGWGLTLLCVGLFEKVVLADAILSPIVERVYAPTANPGFVSAWTGTLAFSGQIFFDFAGYSTCAIGIAMCFGFALMKNFNYPYAAIGFADFWRRWHISLSNWLRDYLFFPLFRGRMSVPRLYANLMTTMLVAGLWHGAAWKFIIWGGLQGVYMVAEQILRRVFRSRGAAPAAVAPVPSAEGGFVLVPRSLAPLALALLTYILFSISLVFFRAENLASARAIIAAMLGRRDVPLALTFDAGVTFAVVTLMLAGHWKMRNSDLADFAGRLPSWLRVLVIAFIITSVLFALLSGDNRAFIYFQF